MFPIFQLCILDMSYFCFSACKGNTYTEEAVYSSQKKYGNKKSQHTSYSFLGSKE